MTTVNDNRMCRMLDKNQNQPALQRAALLLALLLGFALAACSPAPAAPPTATGSAAAALPAELPTVTATAVPTETPLPTPTPEPTPTPFAGPTVTAQDGQVVRWNPETNAYQSDPSFPAELAGQITEVRSTADGALEALGADGAVLATAESDAAEWERAVEMGVLPGGEWINQLLPEFPAEHLEIVIESGVTQMTNGQPIRGISSVWATKYVEGKDAVNLMIKPEIQQAVDLILGICNTRGFYAFDSQTGSWTWFEPTEPGQTLVEEIVVVNTDTFITFEFDRNGAIISDRLTGYHQTDRGAGDTINNFYTTPVYNPGTKQILLHYHLPDVELGGMEIRTRLENKVAPPGAIGRATIADISFLALTKAESDFVVNERGWLSAVGADNALIQEFFRLLGPIQGATNITHEFVAAGSNPETE